MESIQGPRIIRIMQPSYQVDPSIDNRYVVVRTWCLEFDMNRFIPGVIERALHVHLDEMLKDKAWAMNDSDVNNALLEHVIDMSLSKVKGMQALVWVSKNEESLALNLPRYKIVIQGALGEEKGQTVQISSQLLWDTSTDNVAQVKYLSVSSERFKCLINKQQTLWCSIVVIGFYVNWIAHVIQLHSILIPSM